MRENYNNKPSYTFDPLWYRSRYLHKSVTEASACKHYQKFAHLLGLCSCFEEESALYRQQAYVRLSEQIIDVAALKAQIGTYQASRVTPTPWVIFSAVAAGYDSLKIPYKLDARFSYVVFTDQSLPDTGVWEVRLSPYFNCEPTRITRFCKLHPHILFPDAEAAIWVDQNVQICAELSAELEVFLQANVPLGTFFHPIRQSITEEGLVCLELNKDSATLVKAQLARYAAQSVDQEVPTNTNVVFFNLRHPKLPELLTAWWNELESFSRRDQLSLNYALRQSKSSWLPLAQRGICAANHPKFAVLPHDHNDGVVAKIAESVAQGVVNPNYGPSCYEERTQLLSEVADVYADICIYITNQCTLVKDCLESILTKREERDDHLIIIDETDDQDIKEYLLDLKSKYRNIDIVNFSNKLGYAQAINKIIDYLKYDYLILVDSQTILPNNWIEKILYPLITETHIGIVGVLSNDITMPMFDISRSNNIDNVNQYLVMINKYCEMWTKYKYYPHIPYISKLCFGISKYCFNKLNGFSINKFPLDVLVEYDLAFRAADQGFSVVLAPNVYVYNHNIVEQNTLNLINKNMNMMKNLYGEQRVMRATKLIRHHPQLVEMRKKMNFIKNYITNDNNIQIEFNDLK